VLPKATTRALCRRFRFRAEGHFDGSFSTLMMFVAQVAKPDGWIFAPLGR